MTITTTDKTFKELTGHKLKEQSFSRMFNILTDHDRYTKFMNIFHSYTFNKNIILDVAFYNTHEVGHEEWWDNLSVTYYGTPLLWWVIPAYNNVINPFEELEIGTNIKILKATYIYSLLRDLDTIAGLNT